MMEIFVLKKDEEGTTRSRPQSFGVAVDTEKEAKEFEENITVGFDRSYEKIEVFKSVNEALKHSNW